MRNTRALSVSLATLAIMLAACSGGTGASPTGAASVAPATSPVGSPSGAASGTSASPSEVGSPSESAGVSMTESAGASMTESAGASMSESPSGSASGSARTGLKVGVVTDVGTLDDKNFNQFSYEGAQKGAQAVGGTVQAVVTKASADYAANIQSFVDQKYDVIVTIGFALGNDTTKAAKANKDISFVGVDQGICVTEQGDPDPAFGCKGDAATLLPNYQGLVFNEAQPGYLAGILAASISKSGVIGAVGGSKTIPPVVNYIKGYENGAKSVKPDIQVKIAYVSDDLGKAFNDPAGGKAFAQQFIQQQKPDVLFQVAGKTGNGVLAAACDANLKAIGVDVDQHQSTPEAAKCIVTSAEKKLSNAVAQAIQRVADGSAKGGTIVNDAKNDGIGLSPFYEAKDLITPEIQQKLDDALAKMKSGELNANPSP